jgi:Tfp pilus assembly protein PilV
MNRHIQRSQAGDTIVEVMISILIVATILTGAFILSRTSSHNVRSAEERTQALNLLQGQVELLRAAASDPNVDHTSFNSPFCMVGSVITPAGSASCTQSFYSFSIAKGATDPTSQGVTFTAKATWNGIDGQIKYIQLEYRIPING